MFFCFFFNICNAVFFVVFLYIIRCCIHVVLLVICNSACGSIFIYIFYYIVWVCIIYVLRCSNYSCNNFYKYNKNMIAVYGGFLIIILCVVSASLVLIVVFIVCCFLIYLCIFSFARCMHFCYAVFKTD